MSKTEITEVLRALGVEAQRPNLKASTGAEQGAGRASSGSGQSQSTSSQALGELISGLAGRLGGGRSASVAAVSEAATANLVSEEMSRLSAQLEQLRRVGEWQVETTGENTQAITQNTNSRASEGGRSALSAAGSILYPILRSGLGISPLVSGLFGLFRGNGNETPPLLMPYQAPPQLHLEAAIGGSQALQLRDDAGWMNRQATTVQPATGAQIHISVQAMDSRSFMDHSEDIARAVREAMLNSHALNDVVVDL
jgi:hypothetical protein